MLWCQIVKEKYSLEVEKAKLNKYTSQYDLTNVKPKTPVPTSRPKVNVGLSLKGEVYDPLPGGNFYRNKRGNHFACLKNKHLYSINADDVLNYCFENRVPFLDLRFPPVDTSLFRPEIDTFEIDSLPWLRPDEYIKDRICVKYTKIFSKDIYHGHIGDLWFNCALAVVAEEPHRIEKLFIHPVNKARSQKEEAVGAYCITFNLGGWWTPVVIDDYFPSSGNKPAFARNMRNLNELWVSLLEKAYAKVHGSYSSIARGDPLSAMKDLTGFPMTRFDTEWAKAVHNVETSNALFNDLLKKHKRNFKISLNTFGAIPGQASRLKELYGNTPLSLGHSYSITEIHFFSTHNIGLFKIHVPWKSSEAWTGEWSNDSPAWRDFSDIKRHCNFRPEEDFMWMEWMDVLKYFNGGVLFCRNNWYDYRVKGMFKGVCPKVILEISVEYPVRISAILSQKDKRGLADINPDSKYSGMMLTIARRDGTRFDVEANSTNDAENPESKFTFTIARDHAINYTLEPEFSPYLIIPRIYKSRNEDKSYVLGIIAEQAVSEAFQIKFKTLCVESRALGNYVKFKYLPSTDPGESENGDTSAEFQFTAPSQTFINGIGSEIPQCEEYDLDY